MYTLDPNIGLFKSRMMKEWAMLQALTMRNASKGRAKGREGKTSIGRNERKGRTILDWIFKGCGLVSSDSGQG
jgi:hypothetical protein